MSTFAGQGRAARLAAVIGGVLRQAVCDAGANGIVLLDWQSPEGQLARTWTQGALGAQSVYVVGMEQRGELTEPGALGPNSSSEQERLAGRALALRTGTLLAHPANKTALLLAHPVPPEPLLPLGDLYASQVQQLTGEWSGPEELRQLAARVGGVAALDAVLEQMLEGRRAPEDAVAGLGGNAAEDVLRAFAAGRFWRRRVGLVPKLGSRTLGIDVLS